MTGLLIPYQGAWVLELRYLRNEITRTYVTAASGIRLTSLLDPSGAQVTGGTFPAPLTYDPTAPHPGTWRATLPATLVLTPGTTYKGVLDVDVDGTAKDHRELSLVCEIRGRR